MSQLEYIPNAVVCYVLGEGIGPPAGQVYPVCLRDAAGALLSLDRGWWPDRGHLEPPEQEFPFRD